MAVAKHERGHHGRFVAHGEALDDVRGVARLAGPREGLYRLVGRVRIEAGELVQHDRQHDADEAGEDRPGVHAGDTRQRRLLLREDVALIALKRHVVRLQLDLLGLAFLAILHDDGLSLVILLEPLAEGRGPLVPWASLLLTALSRTPSLAWALVNCSLTL